MAVPLFIPTEEGVGELQLGYGEVRGSTLVISFNDLLPAQAIRHRIETGGIVGITFVIPEDEAEHAKETEDEIQRQQDEARTAREAGEITPDMLERDARDLELLDTIEPE